MPMDYVTIDWSKFNVSNFCYGDLREGIWFVYKEKVYIKTEHELAYCPYSGTYVHFIVTDKVQPVDVVITPRPWKV